VIRRTAVLALAGLAAAAPAKAARLTQIGTFSSPVSIAGAPGDPHRIYVVERAGAIRVLVDGVKQATPFLDIDDQVITNGEQGLLSMAIDPAAPTHVYVYYVATNEHIHVDRFDAPTPDAVVGSGTTILDIPHLYEASHYGGQLQFGPDGKLYVATGDGGGVGDAHNNAQKLDAATSTSDPRLGKLLRMNPDGSAPDDNPFAAPADLVWALGLRNPWRWSFDRATGALIIADVGQTAWEEVDFEPSLAAAKGANFGWNMREGAHDYTSPTDTPGPNCCTEPVLEHNHVPDGWAAIIGGYVVRDPSVPDLDGRYVYGDNAKGDLYAASLSGGALSDGPTGMHVDLLSGFGEDAAGHVYAASLAGPVYRIVASPAPGAPTSPGGGDQLPAGGAAPTSTTPPLKVTLSAAARQHVLHTKRFVARVSCSRRCTLKVSAKRTTTRRVTAAAKARVRIVLRPSRHALRLWSRAVRRHHKLVVRISVRATDAAGQVTTRSTKVRVLR
jgi:glucose/arabinose dehydrogenase